MSKAAQHQSIRRDDFLRVGPSAEPTAAFRAPNLPSLADGADEEDELLDETIKLQPINIQVRIENLHVVDLFGYCVPYKRLTPFTFLFVFSFFYLYRC